MAYTGTGTKADPYIVDNWEDFKAVCSNYHTYVAFDPNAEHKVIDINDTSDREGLTNSLYINAEVEGNNWEIRNLYTNTSTIFGNYNTIHALHFVDVISNGEKIVYGPINLKDCRFSALFLHHACFGDAQSTNTATNCSFHFRFLNNSASSILFNRYWTLKYCDIFMEGNIPGLTLMPLATAEFCRITGHVQLGGGSLKISAASSKGSYLVTALKVTGTGTVTAQYAGKTLCLVDTDLLDDALTVTLADNYQGLTTAQMQDADYLLDTLGFPCTTAD